MSRHGSVSHLDIVIVGGGPAGLGAAAHAHQCGADYTVIERSDHLADTIHCYQRGKHVMAEPSLVPQRCELPFEAGSRESVLEAWQAYAEDKQLRIRYRQEVSTVTKDSGRFLLSTKAGEEYSAHNVVLAVGTQGNPNRLKVPGEHLPHVKTRLVDPKDHEDEDIVVVGAGDSAIEIANALSDDNRVSLVIRRSEIVRAKEANEREVLARQASGQLKIFFSTVTERIEPGVIYLNGPDEDLQVKADHVYLKLGAQPPRRWLESLGVEFSSPEPDARPLLTSSYESKSVPGLFLIGAITGRDLIKPGLNQGYEVIEHIEGRDVLPADEEILLEKLPFGSGTVSDRIQTLKWAIPLFADTDAGELKDVLLTVSFRPSMVLQAPSTADLREALLTTHLVSRRDGETIMRQNDYADSLLVLVSGAGKVLQRLEDGGEKEVAQVEAGAFFGELGLISGRRRNATVIAKGDAQLIEFPRKTVLRLMYTSRRVKRLLDEAFLVRAFQGYLFPNVPSVFLRALAKTAETLHLGRNEVVFHEGDEEGDAFYFIRSGQVKIAKSSAGREIILSYLVSGNFFGEEALFAPDRRTATVTTIFPTELVKLTREDLESFVAQFPELEPRFRETYEERRIESLAAEAKPGRYEILDELIRGEVVIGTDALIIDDYKCVRCNNCIVACEKVHDDGQARLSLTGLHFANILAPNSCWQCENPLCMLDCPPDALVRDSRGEIYIRDNCIGCGNCEANCPYDNIFMVHPKPRRSGWEWIKSLAGLTTQTADAGRTVAVKCDLCRDLKGGPACVRSCPTGAAVRLNPDEYQETIGELVARGRRSV